MLPAQVVADGTELLQCIGVLPQLSAIHKADTIEYNVGMNVIRIIVNTINCFILPAQIFLHKPLCYLIGSIWTDLTFLKGNDKMIALTLIHLAKCFLGIHHLSEGCIRLTVHPANQPPVLRLLRIHYIIQRLF